VPGNFPKSTAYYVKEECTARQGCAIIGSVRSQRNSDLIIGHDKHIQFFRSPNLFRVFSAVLGGSAMHTVSMNLLVLRTAQLEKCLTFYQAIGLKFDQEQHGKGPIHYACELGTIVLEIYPGDPGLAPDRKTGGATMLGFQVVALDNLLEVLGGEGIPILSPIQSSAWGKRAVVQDPDGRAIELNQRPDLSNAD
jgi:lactoylglutathione lyase